MSKSFNFFRTLSWIYKRDVIRITNTLCRGKTLDIGGDNYFKQFITSPDIDYVSINNSYDGSENNEQYKADIVGDAMNLPLQDNSFDSVLCFQVLEHVPEPLKLLKEARRVLKEGGIAIFTVPQTNILHAAPHNYYNFTRYGLEHLLRESGFKDFEIKVKGGFWMTMTNRYFDYIMIWLNSTPFFSFDFGYNIYHGKNFVGKVMAFLSIIPAGILFLINLILLPFFKITGGDLIQDSPIHIIIIKNRKA